MTDQATPQDLASPPPPPDPTPPAFIGWTKKSSRRIAQDIAGAKAEIETLEKNGTNTFADYQYATVDDIYLAVRQVLATWNLDLRMDVIRTEIEYRAVKRRSKNGGTYEAISPILHIEVAIGFYGEPPVRRSLTLEFNGPQTYAAGYSYIQKEFLRARFQLETGDQEPEQYQQAEPPEYLAENAPPAEPEIEKITAAQVAQLRRLIKQAGRDEEKFCAIGKIARLEDMAASDFEAAKDMIARVAAQLKAEKKKAEAEAEAESDGDQDS